jgi:hypothetical protein
VAIPPTGKPVGFLATDIMKQSTFRIYHHKINDIKPKIKVFETKAHNRKDALDVFRENFGTLSAVDFIEKGKC